MQSSLLFRQRDAVFIYFPRYIFSNQQTFQFQVFYVWKLWKQRPSAYLNCACNVLRKQCHVSENRFTDKWAHVSLNNVSIVQSVMPHEFRHSFLIMRLLLNCGEMLNHTNEMKNNEGPVGKHGSQKPHAESCGEFADPYDHILTTSPSVRCDSQGIHVLFSVRVSLCVFLKPETKSHSRPVLFSLVEMDSGWFPSWTAVHLYVNVRERVLCKFELNSFHICDVEE